LILNFRCEYCELDFDSEPDGTGYEQVRCPKCDHFCMTIEYLENEKRPIRFSLRTYFIVLIVGSVLALCLLPIWHRHGDVGGAMHGHPIWDVGHVH